MPAHSRTSDLAAPGFPQRCGWGRRPFYLALMAASPSAVSGTPRSGNVPLPPQNLEAEEYVLGAMMLSAHAIEAVSDIIDAGDFYRESHAKIYRAALDLFQHGHPVDAITIADKLDENGELEEVGGKDRIREIATLVPATSNAAPPRADRARDGDAARASRSSARRSSGSAGTGPARRRSSSTAPSRWCSTSPSTGSAARFEHIESPRHARASSRSRRCTSRAAR